MMHEQAGYCDEAPDHPLPITAAFSIIHIIFVEECSCLMQNLIYIHCSTLSHFEYNGHTENAHSVAFTASTD